MNEELSHQSNPTGDNTSTGWQVWLKRGPWIVLIVGMAGVLAQMGATLDLIVNVKGQGAGWSITQTANTVGLGLMNAAIVFFLFLALRILAAGIPTFFKFPTDAPKPAPGPEPEPESVPEPEAAPQEAEAEAEAAAGPSEPAADTTEEDKQGATE